MADKLRADANAVLDRLLKWQYLNVATFIVACAILLLELLSGGALQTQERFNPRAAHTQKTRKTTLSIRSVDYGVSRREA